MALELYAKGDKWLYIAAAANNLEVGKDLLRCCWLTLWEMTIMDVIVEFTREANGVPLDLL
ncbi:hypothetical protein ACHAQA_003129 [Verticillium albo-atrum]